MKKTFKGMTLVEIIVALAIFVIMTLIVATVFTASARVNMMTNAMNNKIDTQIALANVYGTTLTDKKTTTDSITFNVSGYSASVDLDIVELQKNKTVTDTDNQSKIKSNIKYFYNR